MFIHPCDTILTKGSTNKIVVTKQGRSLRIQALREELAQDCRTHLAAYNLLLLDHIYLEVVTALKEVIIALLLMAKAVVIPYHQRTQRQLHNHLLDILLG